VTSLWLPFQLKETLSAIFNHWN